MTSNELDETDEKIISTICCESDVSYSKLAEEIGVSRNTVYRRMDKLKENEIFEDKSITIPDFDKIGVSTIFVGLEIGFNESNEIVEYLEKQEEIKLLLETYGEYDIIAILFVKNLDIKKTIKTLKEKIGNQDFEVTEFDTCIGTTWDKIDMSLPF